MTSSAIKGTAALSKALSVLQTIAEAEEPLPAASIAKITGLPLPTLQRILATLALQGFVERVPGARTYKLGISVLSWAQRTWEQLDVRSAAEPEIEALCAEIGETVQVAVLNGSNIITVDRRDGPHPIRLYTSIGKRGPIHCTGLGKVLLAYAGAAERENCIASMEFKQFTDTTIIDAQGFAQHLDVVRDKGFAFDDEEHQEGVCCIAAPVLDLRGHSVAAISVTAPMFRLPKAKLLEYAPRLIDAALRVSVRLGGKRQP